MTNRKRLVVYNWLSAILQDFGLFKRFRKAFLRRCGVFVHPSVDLSGIVQFVGDGVVAQKNCSEYFRHGGRPL